MVTARRCADKIVVAAFRRVPFAKGPAAQQARVALLAQDRGQLKLVEINRADIGVVDLDRAGVQVGSDEQAGVAGASCGINTGPRLRNRSRVGIRPAIEPGCSRSRRPVRSDRIRTKSLFGEGLVEPGSRGLQLARDFGAQVGWRLMIAYALDERGGEPCRHQEAD